MRPKMQLSIYTLYAFGVLRDTRVNALAHRFVSRVPEIHALALRVSCVDYLMGIPLSDGSPTTPRKHTCP